MSILFRDTPEDIKKKQREQLRIAVERDVNLVLAACLPDNFVSDTVEAKEILGCYHPVLEIGLDPMTGSIICKACFNKLDRDVALLRLEQAKRDGRM